MTNTFKCLQCHSDGTGSPCRDLDHAVGFRLDHDVFSVGRKAAKAEGPCFTGPASPPAFSCKNTS